MGFVSSAHALFLQHLHYLLYRLLPDHVLLNGQAFEHLNRGLWGVLRLQVGLEDVNVIVKPSQVLSLNGADTFQHFTSIEGRFGDGERVGGSGWRLAINEGQGIGLDAEPLKVGPRQLQGDLIAIAASIIDLKKGFAASHGDLIAYQWNWWWLRGGRLGGRFLAGFSHDSVSLLL